MQARGADTALPLPVSCISFFRVTGQNEHGSQELELAISTSANVSSNQPSWLSLLIDRLLAVAVAVINCVRSSYLTRTYRSAPYRREVLDDAVPMCPRVATNIEARRMALFAPSVLHCCASAHNRDGWNGGHILKICHSHDHLPTASELLLGHDCLTWPRSDHPSGEGITTMYQSKLFTTRVCLKCHKDFQLLPGTKIKPWSK